METPSISHITATDFDHVYEPAEDSFFLLDALEKDLPFILAQNPVVCVEVGSGSGLCITALSRYTNSFCIGVDISPIACKITQKTAIHNGVFVDVLNMNLLRGFKDASIDLLAFNPPYVPSRSETTEPFEAEIIESSKSIVQTWAGGINGREVIDRFLEDISRVLAPGGIAYLLVLKENGPKDILRKMKREGLEADIFMERRIIGEHLFVVKFRKKENTL